MPTTDGKPDLSALWPLLPPWIEWVAMDDDGWWHGFKRKPVRITDRFGERWASRDAFTALIPKKSGYCPTWRGDWRKSLTRRPKG